MKMSRLLHLLSVLLLLIGVTVGWSAFTSYSLDEESMIVGGFVDLGCCYGEPELICSGCSEKHTSCNLGYSPPWRGCTTDTQPIYEA